jgi:HD-GYP domain-containing protein (c-di-GMP phosphodiesterase class II)
MTRAWRARGRQRRGLADARAARTARRRPSGADERDCAALSTGRPGVPIKSLVTTGTDDRSLPLVAAVAAFAVIPGAVMEWAKGEPVAAGAGMHFTLVALAALAATVASTILTVAGARRGDGRTVLLGTAFSTMTALLAVHGLATPGVLVGPNGVVAIAGAASLPAGALLLALSALPGLRRPGRIAPLIAAQVAIAVAILALGVSALAYPSLVPPVPATGEPAAYAVLAVGVALMLLIAVRAIRTWQLTRRPADLMTVAGVAWLAFALVAQMTVPYTQLGFYVGHGLEIAGVVALGLPAALDLRHSVASRPLVGDLGATALVAQEEAFLGARVRALLVRLAEKDEATEGHTRRVAMLAVQVGEALGLARSRLRVLALGGLLHDIGKLAVPTAVLRKPGPLDDDEFALIRTHPGAGERLLRDLGGFPGGALRLVLDHHERLDGSGYPRGLPGEELEVETRILAVCDVYDALVSDRVYRSAWSRDRALALLRDGALFDQRCVVALERVLDPSFVADVASAEVAAPPFRLRPAPRRA